MIILPRTYATVPKKALSEKRVSRILGISYPDDMPDGYHGQDPRIWVYIKDK